MHSLTMVKTLLLVVFFVATITEVRSALSERLFFSHCVLGEKIWEGSWWSSNCSWKRWTSSGWNFGWNRDNIINIAIAIATGRIQA